MKLLHLASIWYHHKLVCLSACLSVQRAVPGIWIRIVLWSHILWVWTELTPLPYAFLDLYNHWVHFKIKIGNCVQVWRSEDSFEHWASPSTLFGPFFLCCMCRASGDSPVPSILHRSSRITNVCATCLIWIYVNLGLPSSGPPVCMANTLSTEPSPLNSPLTSFIMYVISLYKSCLCLVRL